jgi:hypothetical protein
MPGRIIYMILTTLIVACWLGCVTGKADATQTRSEIKSWISLASETELFVDQVQRGRLTEEFAESHIQYLRELRDDIKSKEDHSSSDSVGRAITYAQPQIQQLDEIIDHLSQASHNDSLLLNQKARLTQVILELQRIIARL